jgi:hypothetical protein
MTATTHTRRGNALILATIILALVVTGMMALTEQLMGRKKIEDLSRMTSKAQDAAESVAETLCDRIKTNAHVLMADLDTSQNPLDAWLTRGYVENISNVNSTKGLWVNDCLVYWRLEPVASYDRTITDVDGSGISDTDVTALGGTKYMINESLDVTANSTLPARGVGTSTENPGLLFFDLTVDAFAMSDQNRMNANPLAVAANLSGANSADRAPYHVQTKKRVLVKSASLFRYVIFYNASGPSGDIELYQAPNISVVGAVHTNGAAYLGFNVGIGAFGSSPAVPDPNPTDTIPGLKPIAFTAVNGIFCMRKNENYLAGLLNPMNVSRTDSVNETSSKRPGLNPTYLNSVQLAYTTRTVGGFPLQLPSVTGTLQNPLSIARDSRQNVGGIPLNGYDSRLVRDGPNRQLKQINITSRLKMSGYRPLEPFALVGPGIPLRGSNGTYSVVNGVASTTTFATDMLLFQTSSTVQDILPTQNAYAGDSPSPALASLGLPTPNSTAVSAFNTTTTLLPAPALIPPVISRTPSITIDPNDLFSNLATYIQPIRPANSPVLNSYIRNPLGLNSIVTPGVGLVIMERGKQAGIATWPSGRLGQVTWEPPSIYSRNDANTGTGALYYDADGNGVIDAANMTNYLTDYCQWLRSNYVVYFGLNAAGQLVDITDQFFSVPTGAASLSDLLACEDVFKDRREGRWFQSTVNQYITSTAAAYDDLRVNALTLNVAAICTFIRTTPLNRLDPTTASTSPASTRFNGSIYVSRTPRYSNPGTPGSAGKGFSGVSVADQARCYTYRQYGEYHPLAPLGFNQLQTGLNVHKQRTALPAAFLDTNTPGTTLRYPVVGDTGQATVNGYSGHPLVVMGSSSQVWSAYPLLKRVRIAKANAINWGGLRASGRAIGLTIYTPNVCYLWGNFNVQQDSTGNYPACALYCDGLVAQSNNWNDASVNALSGTGRPIYTNATSTVHRLCLVIHNTPTDLANINVSDVWQPGGSGGVHNVIKFLENWSGIDWAFIGSLVVLDRGRYSRGYLGNQDVYEPPSRLYCFNDDLFRELPPFPDVINDVFIW